eukprot:2219989-Prymnesium_polylepis.1
MAHKDYREKVTKFGIMAPKHPDPHALAAHAKEILECYGEGVKVFNPNADNAFKVATVSNARAFAMH